MAQVRKLVRDAVRRILSNPSTGFNARFAALAADYGVDPVEIDFISEDSESFLQARVPRDSDDIQYTQLFPAPLALVLYTDDLANQKLQNSPFFSGLVSCRLDFYIVERDRNQPEIAAVRLGDNESIAEAVEEAALNALVFSSDLDWGPVTFNLDFQSERGDLRIEPDGQSQRISIVLACEVSV